MKVIFLDFDGVINNWDCFDGVDPNNLRPLLDIINLTGAKIVATTSNKYYFQEHPEVEQFLILDDDYVITSLKEHQVFLDLYKGITDEHILPSVSILNGVLFFYPPNFNFNETTEERIIRINQYYASRVRK